MDRIAPLLKRLLTVLALLLYLFLLVVMAGGIFVLVLLVVKGKVGAFVSVLMLGAAALMALALKSFMWEFIDLNLPRCRRFFRFLR